MPDNSGSGRTPQQIQVTTGSRFVTGIPVCHYPGKNPVIARISPNEQQGKGPVQEI